MDAYYDDGWGKIYCCHVLEGLRQIPDGLVQMVMTSPPYWGLRNYAGGSDIVWGGDDNCQHEWVGVGLVSDIRKDTVVAGKSRTEERYYGDDPTRKFDGQHQKHYQDNFCSLCGAWKGQLGLEPTWQLYVQHIVEISREIRRVLRKDGSYYLVLGDTYASSPKGNKEPSGLQSRNYGVGIEIPMKRNVQWGKDNIARPKQKLLIPYRVAMALQEDGWLLRNDITWHKPNSMPSSVKDRLTCTTESVFHFVKNDKTILWRNDETGEWRDTKPTRDEQYPLGGRYKHIETGEMRWDRPPKSESAEWEHLNPVWYGFDYYYDLDAIREPHAASSIARVTQPKVFEQLGGPKEEMMEQNIPARGGADLKQPSKIVKRLALQYQSKYEESDYGQTLQGFIRVQSIAQEREQSRIDAERLFPDDPKRQQGYINMIHDHSGHPKGKNPGDFWGITTQPFKGAHFATFPEALCIKPILSSSRPGDIVLDPMAGSGTTGVVAKRLGRRAIILDVVESYCETSGKRIEKIPMPII